MEFALPARTSFSYSKPSKIGSIQLLLSHGACSLMRDWTILIEAEFALKSDCDHCKTTLPISIGLTKHWIVIASQQRYFTGANESERASWPLCNKSVQVSGKILTLEQIIPRRAVQLSVSDDGLSLNNCCGEERRYKMVTGKDDSDGIEMWRQYTQVESSAELTDEKINTTIDVFEKWREKNSITMLVHDEMQESINMLQRMNMCTNDEYFKLASQVGYCPQAGRKLEERKSILKKPSIPAPPPPPPPPPMQDYIPSSSSTSQQYSSEYVSGLENSCGSGDSVSLRDKPIRNEKQFRASQKHRSSLRGMMHKIYKGSKNAK